MADAAAVATVVVPTSLLTLAQQLLGLQSILFTQGLVCTHRYICSVRGQLGSNCGAELHGDGIHPGFACHPGSQGQVGTVAPMGS